MGWNARVNPAHTSSGRGCVEIFLQISLRVDS